MIVISDGIKDELIFLLISFALGEGLVMLYDVLRIFRKIVNHSVVWISIEDIIYWILAALLIFGMNLNLTFLLSTVGFSVFFILSRAFCLLKACLILRLLPYA